jgi:hypothetical protein
MAEDINKSAKAPNAKQRKDRVSRLLTAIEEELMSQASKASLADYVRLTQLERELEEDEPPREIRITWINGREKSDIAT